MRAEDDNEMERTLGTFFQARWDAEGGIGRVVEAASTPDRIVGATDPAASGLVGVEVMGEEEPSEVRFILSPVISSTPNGASGCPCRESPRDRGESGSGCS